MRNVQRCICSVCLLLVFMSVAYSQSATVIRIHGVDPQSINPSRSEVVKIRFSSSRDAQAIIRIYDRKAYQVKEFSLEAVVAKEINTVIWDGKDERGLPVSDEAYFFTIEAVDHLGNVVEYDPSVKLKAEFKPFLVRYDKTSEVLHFTLEQDSVVDIRSGIADGGPLMVKLLEWKPMLHGEYSIPWDGWDSAHALRVAEHSRHHLYSQIVPLPEYSILTYGNNHLGDRLYSEIHNRDALKRKESTEYSDQLFSQLDVSPYKDISPVFSFEFDGSSLNENGLAILPDEAAVTIRLEESVRQRVTEARYEILVFIDQQFITEIEEGRSPARLTLNTSDIGVGVHLLTVNVVTLQGGVATLSRRFLKKD